MSTETAPPTDDWAQSQSQGPPGSNPEPSDGNAHGERSVPPRMSRRDRLSRVVENLTDSVADTIELAGTTFEERLDAIERRFLLHLIAVLLAATSAMYLSGALVFFLRTLTGRWEYALVIASALFAAGSYLCLRQVRERTH